MRGTEQRKKAASESRKRQREENELRATSYQVVRPGRRVGHGSCAAQAFTHTCSSQLKNPDKIKKMTKKQLRQVKKTRVDKDGSVKLVSPWS